MEADTVTSNDPTHDADEGFDRGKGSGTRSNRNQGIQNEFESSQEDIVSLNRLSDIFSSSPAFDEMHHDVMASSSHSMPSLPSSAVMSPLNNRGGGQFADIFSSSTVERHHHDISSRSMPSLPSFAVNPSNNSRGGQSRMARMERPYNYVTSNNSHDIDESFDWGTRTCSSNQGSIQNEYVPSQDEFNNLSNTFSSSSALDEMHISSSSPHSVSSLPTSSQSLLSMPSLPTSSTETSNKGGIGKLRRSRSLVSSSWNERFHELTQFREVNDHCFVPQVYHENQRLSQWVLKQRQQRKRKDQGLHSTLTDERQELLACLDFCWDSQHALWQERFHELTQFRKVNGHCLVPRIHHENPKLSQWVQKQRQQRKRKDQGLHSTLNDERQELLTIAGFCWDSQQALWEERFQSLEVFQLYNSHCIVPSNHPDSSLYNWVRYQRKQFNLYQAGSKSSMDEERVLRLISIGFK